MKRLLVGTFLFLLALAGPSSAADTKAKPVTVPFELIKSKHIAIKIMINGKGPYRVIFDTGAPITLLNNKTAKASGVVAKNYRPSPFAMFGATGEFKIKTLQVGTLKAANVPVIVMDHPTVSLINKVLGPIEGLVGFPFFAQYEMTIDYQAKTLTFVPSGYKPGNVMRQMEKMVGGLLGGDKPKARVLAPAAQWGFRVQKDAKDQEAGVDIKEVLAGSAAAAAGMKAGDRLLTLDGRWTDSVAECYSAAGRIKAGTAAKVVVKRKGKEVELTVKPVAGL
jgi:hypothetical protein